MPFYIKDNARTESKKEAQKIGKLLEYNYKKLGYHIFKVPFNTIKKRARFILSKIKEF